MLTKRLLPYTYILRLARCRRRQSGYAKVASHARTYAAAEIPPPARSEGGISYARPYAQASRRPTGRTFLFWTESGVKIALRVQLRVSRPPSCKSSIWENASNPLFIAGIIRNPTTSCRLPKVSISQRTVVRRRWGYATAEKPKIPLAA